MQTKTRGVILHQVKYSDSAGIVNIYTRNFGRVPYMVRGINSKRSATRAALLQPLSLVDIEVNHNPKREIQSIKEMRIAVPYREIPFDPVKNAIALFMAEVLHKALRHTGKDEELFDFVEKSVLQLDSCGEGVGNFHLAFMSGLAETLGFSPQMSNGEQCQYFDMMNGIFDTQRPQHLHYLQGEASLRFRLLMQINYETLNILPLTRRQRAESLDNLVEYFRLHLPDFHALHSVDVMHKLWD